MQNAARRLVETVRSHSAPTLKVGSTNAPNDFVIAKFQNDTLLPLSDFISFQTYQNVCDKTGEHCPTAKLANNYAAGVMQQRAISTLIASHLNAKAVILGLPAYDQAVWPVTGETNMYAALRKTTCLRKTNPEIFGDSYWSLRNIELKRGDAAYAKRFLLACTPDAAEKYCDSATAVKPTDLTAEIAVACPTIGH
jgi:hypothetical protein